MVLNFQKAKMNKKNPKKRKEEKKKRRKKKNKLKSEQPIMLSTFDSRVVLI